METVYWSVQLCSRGERGWGNGKIVILACCKFHFIRVNKNLANHWTEMVYNVASHMSWEGL